MFFFFQKYLKGEDTGFDVCLVDVYNEFNERVAEKYKIPKFKSKVCSNLENNYFNHCNPQST